MALSFGLIYIFLVPPFQAPDEPNHLLRAYHISEGYFFGIKTKDKRLGAALPESLKVVSDSFRVLRYDYQQKTSLDKILQATQIPLAPAKRSFLDFPNVAYYAPTAYLPQFPVIFFARLLQLPPLLLMYLGRLATFAFWVACVGYAIRILPFHQWTLSWISLLPASLFLHASLTADSTTNGLAFLLIAQILNISFAGTSFTRKRAALILSLSLLITINKVVYAPLILLLFFLTKDQFGSFRKKVFSLGAIFLAHAIVLFIWYQFAGDLFIPYDQYHPIFREGQQLNPGVNPKAQLFFILQYPFTFIKTLVISYAESAPATLAHYIGKFGWEKNYLPAWLLGILAASLLASALLEKKEHISLRNHHRALLLITGIIMILAFSCVIYMQWSPVGNDRILSLSGRYFIPVFPLFLLALYPNGRFQWLSFHPSWWICLFIIAQFIGIFCVLQRYYYL